MFSEPSGVFSLRCGFVLMLQPPCLIFLSALLCPVASYPTFNFIFGIFTLRCFHRWGPFSALPIQKLEWREILASNWKEYLGGRLGKGCSQTHAGKRAYTHTHTNRQTVWWLRDYVGAHTPPLPKITSR